MEKLIIEVASHPKSHDVEFVEQQLSNFNKGQAGESNYQSLSLFLKDSDHHIVGGLLGEISRQWLHIDVLWVNESLRNQGHGKTLLNTAEQEAVRRGCRYAYLDTFSFQAPIFYQKCGYICFGELQDFPEGYSRFFLRKELSEIS